MPYILFFTLLLLCCALSGAAAEEKGFQNPNAVIGLGLDGRVYLAAGDRVLSCKADGSDVVLGATGEALKNAVADAHGIIAAAHAHFAKNVTLYDAGFHVVGRFTRVGDYNFTAPAEVAVGASGDFYVLDQGRDQVIRFHPDGIRCAIYRIPHDPAGPRDGYLTRFRVCEAMGRLYVANWASIRCFSIEAPDFAFTPKLLWSAKSISAELSWGYGGFDVDDKGVMYTIPPLYEPFLTVTDPDGKPLPKIPLAMDKPDDPARILGLCIHNGEAYVKRRDDRELFRRFRLDTGALVGTATLPDGLTARAPAPEEVGMPAAPVKSTLGIPRGRNTLRVLFVGNSQVNCVRDIPDMLEEISRSSSDPRVPLLLTDEVVIGGVGLEGLWKQGIAHARIAAGRWDYVVLNEIVYSFGMTNAAKFADYAGRFDAEIHKTGAKMVFFVTADVDKQREQHAQMYADALAYAQTAHATVAGCGMAWLKAWEKEPTLDFHFTDRAHPNPLGYYFNALVLYATLTGSNPATQHLATCDAATPEQAAMLQALSWQQYGEDRVNEKAKP